MHEGNYYDAYQYYIDTNVNQLPDWALYTMIGEYRTNNLDGTKTYVIPPFLEHEITKSPEDAILEARQDLRQHLPPPDSWVLWHDNDFMPLMLPSKNLTQQFKEELEELKGLCNQPPENSDDWDMLPQSDLKKDKEGPGYGY